MGVPPDIGPAVAWRWAGGGVDAGGDATGGPADSHYGGGEPDDSTEQVVRRVSPTP